VQGAKIFNAQKRRGNDCQVRSAGNLHEMKNVYRPKESTKTHETIGGFVIVFICGGGTGRYKSRGYFGS